MRCLNCNTVVADSDPCCFSCGARCTTPVSKQGSGKPIPFVALALLAVGWVAGYADAFNSGESKRLAIHDRKAGKERMFEANIWGLGGLFLGLPVDLLIWSFLRRKNSVGQRQSPATPAVYLQPQAAPSSRNPAFLAQANGPAVSLQVQARPSRGYRGIVRLIFGVAWAVLFFIGAVFITSMVVVGISGGDPEQNQVANDTGQRLVPWFFFGSIILAGILAKLGKLPGTRLKKA